MTTDFLNAQRRLDHADFALVEATIGHVLPKDVREHYQHFNGGEPENSVFELEGVKYLVVEFYSMVFGEANHTIENNFHEMVNVQKLVPTEYVPFGIDPFGDFYCFHERSGAVIIFRSEHFPDQSRCITALAKSFSSFVAGLSEDSGN